MFYTILLCIITALSAAVNETNAFCLVGGNSVTCASRMTMGAVTKGVIVGGGRIGRLLYESNGKHDVLVKRGEEIPNLPGPIYLATRNNDLEDIINKTPKEKVKDLVFLQNGMLAPYLAKKGLSDNTQGLIYFAVAKLGDAPIDGRTEVNPEGLTAVTGKWGDDFALRLKSTNLSCHVMDKKRWFIAMLEKLIWISAFMAIGAKYKGITVGEVETVHNAEVRNLIDQLAKAASLKENVVFPPGLGDRLCSYSKSVAHFPTALKEFEYRNGWFVEISVSEIERNKPDPCPLHSEIMESQGLYRK